MPTRKVFKDSDAEEDEEVGPLPDRDSSDAEKHGSSGNDDIQK
jgi:hypothetical protein